MDNPRPHPDSFPVAVEKDFTRAHCIKGSANFLLGLGTSLGLIKPERFMGVADK